MTMINEEFQRALAGRKEIVDEYIAQYLEKLELHHYQGLAELKKSLSYSLSQGGKRFRPVLAILLAEEFGVAPQRILPFATAVEMIHTYSLIHDDLPCLDNDDYRRGQPTNHKVFGEATALLAGDALLTESFRLIGQEYQQYPETAIQLVQLLALAAGIQGMVGGQAIDMKAKGVLPNQTELTEMHAMKTGALIRVSCEGAASICGLPTQKIQFAKDFGAQLGFAFQLADDLLDSTDGQIEKGSFPDLLGIEKTQNILNEVSAKAQKNLQNLGILKGNLYQLIEYNLHRQK